MTRRSFFSRMIAAGVAATIDPDKLLWVPGQVHYSIPAVAEPQPLIMATYRFASGWQVTPDTRFVGHTLGTDYNVAVVITHVLHSHHL